MLREVFWLDGRRASVALALQSGRSARRVCAHSSGELEYRLYAFAPRPGKTGCHSVAALIRKLDEFRIPLLWR